MPTTTYTDFSAGVRDIGERTDAAGTPVVDLSAEEDRYSQIVLGPGVLQFDSFYPLPGAALSWNVVLGSGDAKHDYALVPSLTAEQGNYLVRMADPNKTVTLAAADPSLPRIDEIYLVVQDNNYDLSGVALPRLAVRRGDAAGTPTAPGPDASWKAFLLLATVTLPGGAADITGCTVTDSRSAISLFLDGEKRVSFDVGTGDTVIEAPAFSLISFIVNGVVEAELTSTALDLKGNSLTNVGSIGDIVTHNHGAAGGATISYNDLGDLDTPIASAVSIVTAPQTLNNGVPADLTGLTVTINAPAGRRVGITFDVPMTSGTNIEQTVKVYEGAQQLSEASVIGTSGINNRVNGLVVVTPSAGAHTYKLVGSAIGGTVNMSAAATRPALLLVTDLGPAV